MTEGTPVTFRCVTVAGVASVPDGKYLYADDVLNMMAVIGMAKGVDLSKEIRDIKEMLSS